VTWTSLLEDNEKSSDASFSVDTNAARNFPTKLIYYIREMEGTDNEINHPQLKQYYLAEGTVVSNFS
jgi:hypothetical protein